MIQQEFVSRKMSLANNHYPPKTEPAAQPGAPAKDGDKARPYYSMANILDAAKKDDGLSLQTLKSSADSVFSSKCFRTAFLWAAALGGLFAAHRFKQGGTALRATNDGVLAAMGTFGAQWYLCRADEVDKRVALKVFYMQQARKTSGANAPSSADDALEADAPVDDDAIRREMERVTQYDLPHVSEGPAKSVQIR